MRPQEKGQSGKVTDFSQVLGAVSLKSSKMILSHASAGVIQHTGRLHLPADWLSIVMSKKTRGRTMVVVVEGKDVGVPVPPLAPATVRHGRYKLDPDAQPDSERGFLRL